MSFLDRAEDVLKGKRISDAFFLEILRSEISKLNLILAATDKIRRFFFKDKVELCAICNAKSGFCSEDCSFCSQSSRSRADIEKYPLLKKEELLKALNMAKEALLHRYSFVSSGKSISFEDLDSTLDIFKLFPETVSSCASFGILKEKELKLLKNAGLKRYHHNLETAASFFPSICTTHKYEERLETLRAVKKAGLELCSGGIFGLGESDEQILELARCLEEFKVDAIPLNFLLPVSGTDMEKNSFLTPFKCLKIIAAFRFFLPQTPLIICGGREKNLASLQALIFSAGASGLMVGDFLTSPGVSIKKDLAMLSEGEWKVS